MPTSYLCTKVSCCVPYIHHHCFSQGRRRTSRSLDSRRCSRREEERCWRGGWSFHCGVKCATRSTATNTSLSPSLSPLVSVAWLAPTVNYWPLSTLNHTLAMTSTSCRDADDTPTTSDQTGTCEKLSTWHNHRRCKCTFWFADILLRWACHRRPWSEIEAKFRNRSPSSRKN